MPKDATQKETRQAGKRQERRQAWRAGRAERQAQKVVQRTTQRMQRSQERHAGDLGQAFKKLTAPRKAKLGILRPSKVHTKIEYTKGKRTLD